MKIGRTRRGAVRIGILLILCASGSAPAVWAQGTTGTSDKLAFPTAEGYGRFASGGRGGAVYKVTSLNDSGSGTLRACVAASGPRTCVFDISGVISLASGLRFENPDITVAGQTAPGDGVLVKGSFDLRTDNVIIRHMVIRPGPGGSRDAISMYTTAVSNIIIDHSSLSWSTDEILGASNGPSSVTVQWSILAESLHCSTHPEGCHGKGILTNGDGGANPADFTFAYNYIAHHRDRIPFLKSADNDWVNNVFYNHGVNGLWYPNQGPMRVNLIGNYYKPGTDGFTGPPWRFDGPDGDVSTVYVAGNCDPRYRPTDKEAQTANVRNTGSWAVTTSTRQGPNTYPAEMNCFEARDSVLSRAGATVPRRNAIDSRVLGHFNSGGGKIIDDPSEVGGYPSIAIVRRAASFDTDKDGIPDAWEQANGLQSSNANDGQQIAANGYTNLENYLNELAGDTSASGNGSGQDSEVPRPPTNVTITSSN